MPYERTPEIRARIAATLRRRYEDPEFRAQMLEVVQAPKRRAKIAEGRKGWDPSPETRARTSVAAARRMAEKSDEEMAELKELSA